MDKPYKEGPETGMTDGAQRAGAWAVDFSFRALWMESIGLCLPYSGRHAVPVTLVRTPLMFRLAMNLMPGSGSRRQQSSRSV